MEEFLAKVAEVNGVIYNFVWVTIGIVLLLGAGVICTIVTKGFQFAHFGHWVKETIGSIFTDKSVTDESDKHNISQAPPGQETILLEVTLQQALQSDAVTSLVTHQFQ